MTDDGTRYDQQGLAVQLTGERSENGARRLAGYQPDVRPDADWPGLSEATGEARFEPEEMKRVAQWLDERSGAVQGLPAWLSSGTAVSYGHSSWHEANHLKEASDTVAAAVAEFIGLLVATMGQASASIQTAGGTYSGTENANLARFDAIGASVTGEQSPGAAAPAAGGVSSSAEGAAW